MKIIVAKTAGFCMGVHRVVDMAVDMTAKSSRTVYSLGPLIHNNQTLDMLNERGIRMLDEKNPPDDGATILIRAHGVPPQTQERFEQRFELVDGTCPKVKTVHKVIQKYRERGFTIVIAGDEGHAEVIGLLGYAGDAGILIQTPGDVDTLPDPGLCHNVCLVSQTTFDRETFDAITQRVNERYRNAEVVIKKTICAATDRRQAEVHEMARSVDALIVVGGKNSANTLRLANIARSCGAITQHIETEQEIDWQQLAGCNSIGITAGASTPGWMIKRVADHCAFLDRTNRKTPLNKLAQFFEVLANTNFFVAAGGAALYYTSSIFQELSFERAGAVIASLYLLSIYLWNSLTCLEKNKHLDISRYRFYQAHKRSLTALALSCITILLVISLWRNHSLFYLMLVPTIAGCVYQFTFVPQPLRKYVKYGNLKDIPTSRDLFAALAWAVLITFIPQAIHGIFKVSPGTIGMFVWTFFLAYLRSLIFDLRDIEGDRIMGRETLITIIGEKWAKRLIYLALLLCGAVLSALFFFTYLPNLKFSNIPAYTFLLQMPVLVHIWIFMRNHRSVQNNYAALFNILVDGQFFIAGFGAWLGTLIAEARM